MDEEGFKPQAESIDGRFFIETAQTARVTAALWALLQVARTEPEWLPVTVLCGPPGAGKSALAARFADAARRSVACDLLAGRRASDSTAVGWPRRMTEARGACPEMCKPGAWAEHALREAIRIDAASTYPTVELTMGARPDKSFTFMGADGWHSPGNTAAHPTRRTSIAFVDDADRLLAVPPSRRRAVLEHVKDYPARMVRHRVAMVLLGSPELADAVSALGATQVIRLDGMAHDSAFADVVAMTHGTRDPVEVEALHAASSGLMGRLIHLAAMRGRRPPFCVEPDHLLTLPSPPPDAEG